MSSQTEQVAGDKERSFFDDFKRLPKLWPYLRDNKRLVILAAAMIPFISLLQMSLPLVIRHVIDDGIAESNYKIIATGSLLFLGVVMSEYAVRAVQSISSAMAIHRMIKSLRSKLVQHILMLSARFHDRTLSGRLVTRATSDFDNLSESLNLGVLTSVIDLAVLIGSFTGLFLLDWRLALCTLVLLPLVGTVVYHFSNALKKAMLAARSKLAILNGFTQECLQASATIKLLNAQKEQTKRFSKMNVDYRDTQMKSVMLDASMFAVIDGMSSITIGLLLWVALTKLAGVESITAGVMVAFIQYIQQVFEPLKNLGNKVALLQGAFTAIDRVFGVLDTHDFISGSKSAPRLKGQIDFSKVGFAYNQPDKPGAPILKEVSFHMEKGDSLAIVGSTGSGKSTIIKLLTKLYDGYTGTITIDGHNIKDFTPDTIRSQIAIVPQDIVIFEGSIRFNIGLGLEQVKEEHILNATKIVGADLFIDKLPGGLDFHLTEDGTNLSHGQRQLITFARALARQPALIVLDEATSSVDPESEALIQTGIESMLAKHSVIVIAHRLSTIRNCDSILVLDKGLVVEQGSHDMLMEKGGYYRRLLEEGDESNKGQKASLS